MDRYNLVSFLGLFALCALAWLVSSNRRRVRLRVVTWGIVAQLVFGAFVFRIPAGSRSFLWLSDAVVKLLGAASAGAHFCFGPLALSPGQEGSLGFILVCQAFPTIVFFAALMELLYFIGLMPLVIRQFARLFARVMGVSGAEALCTASNIFVGIESTTTVLPYLKGMTRSELCTILTAGLATIASSVLGLYVMLLQHDFPHIAGHLISASLLSAPAALVMSKLLLPETETPATLGREVTGYYERPDNALEAVIRGATNGGKLALGIIVMLLALLGIVALINLGLDVFARAVARTTGWSVSLRLENLLAVVFYPLALLLGMPPADAWQVARLLGMRAIMTEVPAYQELNRLMAAGAFLHARSAVLAAYALCGFTHVASVAIFVGGTAALAPNQTRALSRVAGRAFVAATLACLMTAAVAGTFFGCGSPLFGQ